MKNLYMIKRGTVLVPASDEVSERLKKIKEGKLVLCDVVVPRNYEFFKKFYSLLNFAFQYWEPESEEINKLHAVKDFNRFRKDVIIMAGYRDVVVNIKGEVRYEAKSIGFGSMGEEEFQQLYKSAFNVLWNMVLSNVPNMTEEEAQNAVNNMLSYDG